jgi:hypothetical protein
MGRVVTLESATEAHSLIDRPSVSHDWWMYWLMGCVAAGACTACAAATPHVAARRSSARNHSRVFRLISKMYPFNRFDGIARVEALQFALDSDSIAFAQVKHTICGQMMKDLHRT